ncbi:methyl-accepting chemotaxis protein [Robertmurraya sp. P23]|uniref:methyl-accepting chemotaxis protein n=1 Tax=Robertmurraya sp. P23 TaxID=3436931 RepID=UPI003D975CC4
MKIQSKLIVVVTILFLSLIVTGTLSVFQIHSTKSAYLEMQEDQEVQFLLKSLQYRFTGISNDERAFLLTGDMELVDGIAKKVEEIESCFSILSSMNSLASEDKEEIQEIQSNLQTYFEKNQEMVEYYTSGEQEKALKIHMEEERSIRKELVDPSIDTFLTKINKEIEADKKIVNEDQKTGSLIQYIVIGLSIIFGVIVAFFIIRSIVKPLNEMTKRLKDIAEGEGDLTHVIHLKSKDELGVMAISFNQMVGKLRDLMKQVSDNADQVAAAAEQLNVSSQETTKATEQIASTVEQVAAGTDQQVLTVKDTSIKMSDLSSRLSSIASKTEWVASNALSTATGAVEGNKAIEGIAGKMDDIHSTVEQLSQEVRKLGERSGQISEIVKVITGIAEQTNLLALNAAIEAARAGENGRGFAVVSDEVRKLAEQSAASASQISQLIGIIQSDTNQTLRSMDETTIKVNEGTSYIQHAGQSFKEIEQSVSEVSSEILKMARSVQEISKETEQMVVAIEKVGDTSEMTAAGTQSMAASTEEQLAAMDEISSSSDSLAKMAEDLQQLIGKFKV